MWIKSSDPSSTSQICKFSTFYTEHPQLIRPAATSATVCRCLVHGSPRLSFAAMPSAATVSVYPPGFRFPRYAALCCARPCRQFLCARIAFWTVQGSSTLYRARHPFLVAVNSIIGTSVFFIISCFVGFRNTTDCADCVSVIAIFVQR